MLVSNGMAFTVTEEVRCGCTSGITTVNFRGIIGEEKRIA